MNTGQVFPRRGMSIRANLSWVLAGTLVCGLCIAGYFSWSFTTLERMQYEVSSHSLALRELHSVSEQLDLLMVSSDLAIGSDETYTAQIAMSLANELALEMAEIGADSSLPYEQKQIAQFITLLMELEQQIKAYEGSMFRGHDTGPSDLLSRFDNTSGELVRNFEAMSLTAQAFADQKSAKLSKKRAQSATYHIMALLLYFMANAIIVYWAIRRIAWPLETLTHSVDEAMDKGSQLATSFGGPLELTRLARHFARLVAQLEQKVAARTGELLEKTERLEQEVADRKAMQEALETAKENAEKSSRVKSEFLSVMSHELRTPMNAVLGSLSLIRDSGINAEQQEYVDIADESGKALVELLGEILDLSKIESGEIGLKSEPFSVHEILSTTVNMLQGRVSEKGLRMSASIHPDVPASLVGDFNRLRQILINLVNNAIKFTDEGFVDIQISMEAGDGPPRLVRFSVTDTGIGVEGSDCTEIFNSFTQADSSLSREHSGVGLGLSICRKLAQAMGGTCGVESAPGQGSTFWFNVALPASADEAGVPDWRSSVPQDAEPVLVVGNGDTFGVTWLSKVLDMYGVPFKTALDVEASMAELRAANRKGKPYGCIIVLFQGPDPSEAPRVRRLASTAHELGGRIVLLSNAKEPALDALMENGQIDAWQYGTVCQGELMKTILNITEDASPPALEARTPSIAEPGRRGIRILIVEDSRASRLIAAAILQNAGFEVGEAGSGAEAIEKFRKADFDLVLMDLQMSGMDGFEATRAIRNLEPECSNTPIIAFSANVMEEARHHCLEAGMNDFVSKPFVKETLLDRIAQWT